MSPRVAVLIIVLALGLAGAAWVLWAPSPAEAPEQTETVESPDAVVATADQPMTPASLYFLGEDGWLHGVEIEVPAEDGESRVRALVNALLAGPRPAGMESPLPGVRLDRVYFLDASSVALDLRLRAETPPAGEESDEETDEEAEGEEEAEQEAPPAPEVEPSSFLGRVGSKQELLAIYSLVNTVALGSETVDKVTLLLNGKQPETLSGHIDLTRPLRADLTWIAHASREQAAAQQAGSM